MDVESLWVWSEFGAALPLARMRRGSGSRRRGRASRSRGRAGRRRGDVGRRHRVGEVLQRGLRKELIKQTAPRVSRRSRQSRGKPNCSLPRLDREIQQRLRITSKPFWALIQHRFWPARPNRSRPLFPHATQCLQHSRQRSRRSTRLPPPRASVSRAMFCPAR